MTVITDITELIGNTPLLRLKNFDVPEGVAVYAKLASETFPRTLNTIQRKKSRHL